MLMINPSPRFIFILPFAENSLPSIFADSFIFADRLEILEFIADRLLSSLMETPFETAPFFEDAQPFMPIRSNSMTAIATMLHILLFTSLIIGYIFLLLNLTFQYF